MKNLRLLPDFYRNHACTLYALERSKQAKQLPEMLGHSLATHLLEKGTDLRYIHELLGHGDSKTTEIYMQTSKKSLANIKSPLDHIEEQQSIDNEFIKKRKHKTYKGNIGT